MELSTFKYEMGANLIDTYDMEDFASVSKGLLTKRVTGKIPDIFKADVVESKEEEDDDSSSMDSDLEEKMPSESEQYNYNKGKKGITARLRVITSSSSSVSSVETNRKRSYLGHLDISDSTSSTDSKRSRLDSSDSDMNTLDAAFQQRANVGVSTPWDLPSVFDPRKVLPTTKNMKMAFRVMAQAEERVQTLRHRLDMQPLNGEVRRAYLNACDYLELLSIFVRQDTISTEWAKEVYSTTGGSKSKNDGLRLTIPTEEEESLPDVVPISSPFKYVNGVRLSKCLYGYIARYDRVSKNNGSNNTDGDRIDRVAIKISYKQQILMRQAMNGKFVQENPIRELRIQQAIAQQDPSRHDVLSVDQVLESDDKLFAVCPFVDQDMFSYVVFRERMDESDAKRIFRDMVKAVEFCHNSGVCHRDLSLENFLMRTVPKSKTEEEHVEPVLIDFGLCSLMEPDRASIKGGWLPIPHTGAVGKYGYMAPEVYNQNTARVYDGPASDVWSLGVCLFSMLTRFPPWERPESSDKHFQYMVEGGGIKRYLEGNRIELSRDAVHLLEQIFRVRPADRLTIPEILEHPWLRQVQ